MENGVVEGRGFLSANPLAPADEVEHTAVGLASAFPLGQGVAHHGVGDAEAAAGFGDVALGENRAEDFEGGHVHFSGEGEGAVGEHFIVTHSQGW